MIHSSFVDSFPNLIIESIENYIPFISSRIFISNALISDKKLLFDPKSIEALDKSLDYIFNILSSDIKKEIFTEYCKELNFGWEQKIEELVLSKIKAFSK